MDPILGYNAILWMSALTIKSDEWVTLFADASEGKKVKQLLEMNGLSVYGSKADGITRLTKHLRP